jgi:methyl-accepting chemotaxis protein
MTLSIRNILVGIFLLLSAVICVLTASSAMDAYNEHRIFNDVSKLTALDRALFQTLATFRNERGDGSSAAKMEIDALAGTLASLKKDRGLVDIAMAEAKAIYAGIDDDAIKAPIADVMNTFDQVLERFGQSSIISWPKSWKTAILACRTTPSTSDSNY